MNKVYKKPFTALYSLLYNIIVKKEREGEKKEGSRQKNFVSLSRECRLNNMKMLTLPLSRIVELTTF